MKLKILALTLILILSFSFIPVSAVNFATYYFDTEWYQAIIALLVEFPSLVDKDYAEQVRLRGALPIDAIIDDESESGEIAYSIPYMCCFFNPGDEMKNVLEPYILYAPVSGENFFFMVYRFNEASGKYEFAERTPLISSPVNDFIKYPYAIEEYNFVVADEFIEYAQEIYNNGIKVKVAPQTSDDILYYFLALTGIVMTAILIKSKCKIKLVIL